MTSQERRAQRLSMVDRYRSSPLTLDQFAEQEGVSRETVRRWCRIAEQASEVEGGSQAFVEVSIPRPATDATVEIALGEAIVRVPTSLSIDQMSMIFRAIKAC